VSITESISNSYEVPSPTYNEMCTIINKLKSYTAAGSDNIHPELIKMEEEI
jgi:hypothetical protein